MTIEDKRNAIQAYCAVHTGCIGCELSESGVHSCFGVEADIDSNYALIFGNADKDAEAPAVDNVNHPAHYETGKYECIDVMCEALGVDTVKSFCLCNAFKYIYRCMNKHDSPVVDVEKARWYLSKFLELEGKSDD